MTAFDDHLGLGVTSVCRCWAIDRTDGVRFNFTDHDGPVQFLDRTFEAETGLTARAVVQATGLSVDNSEALGVLSSARIRDEDIDAGLFDGARVTSWLVNWQNPVERVVQFRGTLGEITRAAGAFQAELRGLTEGLNTVMGRSYHRSCSAVLGDTVCSVDLSAPGYTATATPQDSEGAQRFWFSGLSSFEMGWFERGRLIASATNTGVIKSDKTDGLLRRIDLWAPLPQGVPEGALTLEAGCDKRAETCRLKFSNMTNFRGCPDIPGEDWLARVPRRDGVNGGGSLR